MKPDEFVIDNIVRPSTGIDITKITYGTSLGTAVLVANISALEGTLNIVIFQFIGQYSGIGHKRR